MKKRSPKSTRFMVWTISGLAATLFLAGAVGAIKLLLSDDGGKRKRRVQMITLLKPPPPPKIKEKPPEPEIKKKQEIIEQEKPPEDPVEDEAMEDEGPMDEDLGLDADGAAGTDGFGLKAKRGGRSIIGGYGKGSLLRKYAWYTNILQQDLRKKVNKHMEKNGGMPEGDLTAHIQITLDTLGRITALTIKESSGDEKMDRAIHAALLPASVSEPPPKGMPRVLQLKISSKG
jgi:TonB family protein